MRKKGHTFLGNGGKKDSRDASRKGRRLKSDKKSDENYLYRIWGIRPVTVNSAQLGGKNRKKPRG